MNPFRDMTTRPERGDWREKAVCGAVDNEGNLIHDISDWHPDGNKKERAEARARARRKCVACPVAMSCFAEALANEELTGVWGGVDIDETRRRTREPLDPGYGKKWQTLARQSRRAITKWGDL